MLIQASNLINRPVYCLETKSAVGRILDIIIDPKNGKLAGLKVSPSFLSPYKILSSKDIIAVQPNFVAINKESALVKPEEVIPLKKIIDSCIRVLGNWAKTKDGEWLGKIDDLVIDATTLSIIKYYIKGMAFGFRTQPFLGTFKENRIILAEDIVSINKDAIIVKSEPEIKEKVTVPELAS